MPKFARLAILPLLIWIAPLFAQDLASFEKRITTKILPNGLTLIVCERPEAPVFSFYTLVDAGSGPSDAKLLLDEAELVGMPVRHLTLDDPRLCQLYGHRLVLVRPDLHIAWSGTTVTDPAEVVARVRGA